MRRLLLVVGLVGCDDGGGGGTATPDGSSPPDTAVPADAAPDGGVEVRPLVAAEGELRPVLLSVFAPEPGVAWFAGGTPGPLGGVVARLDGDRIVREPTPAGPNLWWVYGPTPDRRWAVGDAGRVIAWRDGTWSEEDSGLPTQAQLWGVWGSSAEDLWAVGGSARLNGPKGVVLRRDASGWRRIADPALPADGNLFKVWGSGANDVHLVGERGVALHWDGQVLRRLETPSDDLLFTVHGRAGGPVLAVGGTTGSRVLRLEGERWADDGAPAGPPLSGVFVAADGTAIITGSRGTVLRRSKDGGYTRERHPELTAFTLHAAWSGPETWAVGGDLSVLEPGIVLTDRQPTPRIELGPAPDASVPDATPPDGALVDAVSDAALPDASRDAAADAASDGSPDASRPDAGPHDAGPHDAGPHDAVVADLAVPDARPADLAVPDAAPADLGAPDAGPELPGPAAACADHGFNCAGGNVCLAVFTDEGGFSPPICLQPCALATDCHPAFGAEPCCIAPGPQLVERYCVPRVYHAAGCPG